MATKHVTVKYRYFQNGRWVNSQAGFWMDNPNPSESMLRSKIMSQHSRYDDVEIIDYKVG